jgi:gamma-glutamylcysteine synthetase
MSTKVSGPQGPVISSRDELVAYLEQGAKPARDWRIGTEHEKFGFYRRGYGRFLTTVGAASARCSRR